MSTDDRFERLVEEARSATFSGWDFSFLDGRRILDQAPWNYEAIAREAVARSTALIDIGTGGGEVLSASGPFPPVAVATEAYLPNVRLAADRLNPLGVDVVQVDDNIHHTLGPDDAHPERRLPFRDGAFDLVLARNSAYSPAEAFRVLRSGGWLVSQNGLPGKPGDTELCDHLQGPGPDWGHWDFLRPAQDAGFDIETYAEFTGKTRYRDIGAVVYVLENIPWTVTDFTIDKYRDRLRELHAQIEREGELVTHGRACFLRARKPRSRI